MAGNGNGEVDASLKAHAAAAAVDPRIANLFATFKGMIDRGEIASICISAVRHDGLPASGFMGAENVPARMLLYASTLIIADEIKKQILLQATMTDRPSPILRPGRPPGM